MKVALYARVSTKSQEKKGTIGSQIEALRNYTKEQKYVVAEDYVCRDDGYSGASLARPELDRLRDGAQAGAFDGILVVSPDRLSRKYAYLILILEEFERFGTQVIFLEHPPSDDPHTTLLVQIQGAFAEYTRAKLLELSRRAKLYRARQGEIFWTNIPYGYRRIPRQDSVPAHLVINEAEAEVVRKIFTWHAYEEMTIRQIAKRLTREGYPTAKGGQQWGETIVHRILRREAYLGTLCYNRSRRVWIPASGAEPARTKTELRPQSEWIPVSIPPIIDRETFERSQARHAVNQQFSPRNLRAEHWLLRRLVRCEKCGLKCTCIADKKRPQTSPAHYYRCANQERLIGRPRCRPNHVRSKPLDDFVWHEVRRHLLQPELLLKAQRAFDDSQSLDESGLAIQLNNARKRITQVQGERRRLIDAFQGGFIEKNEFEERSRNVSRRISSLQDDIKALEEEQENASGRNELLTRISHFTSAITHKLDEMTFAEKQTVVRTVLKEVGINGNTVKLYFKIPLPKAEKKTSERSSASSPKNALSSELDLRSRRHGAGCSRRGCREVRSCHCDRNPRRRSTAPRFPSPAWDGRPQSGPHGDSRPG